MINKGEFYMKDYEIMLKKIIDNSETSGEFVEVKLMKYEQSERMAIDYLKNCGYINNVRFMPDLYFGCDLTYEGLHYFD